MAKPRPVIAPIQTEDRQLNTFNKDTRLALVDAQQRLEVLESPQALVVPPDDHTLFWWPCNETGPRWNEAIRKAPSQALAPLVTGGGLAAPAGLVTPYAMRVVELTTLANRGVDGAAGAFASLPPRGITLSAWARVGGDFATPQKLYIGIVQSSGANMFDLALNANGLVESVVQLVGAGSTGVNTTLDAAMTPHEWNHVALCLDTVGNLYTVVNGIMTVRVIGADTINWALGAPLRFIVGYPGSTSYCGGLVQDIRLETTARTETYLANAWRRGKQLTVI